MGLNRSIQVPPNQHEGDTLLPEILGLGDSLAPPATDVAAYLEGSTLRVIKYNGTVVTETAEIGQGLQDAFDEANAVAVDRFDDEGEPGRSVLWIAPGFYDAQDVASITCYKDADDVTTHVMGHGARINCSVVDISEEYALEGITVTDGRAGANGFEFVGGQKANHRYLTAIGCGQHGFVFGGGQDNAQVSRSTFDSFDAQGNGGDGFRIDSSGTNAWINANTFINPSATVNGGIGFHIIGSTSNYNTFISSNHEGNTTYSVHLEAGRDNTWVGGHLVTQARFDDLKNYVIGGRWPNGFDEANGVLPVNLAAGTPNFNDTATAALMERDLSGYSPPNDVAWIAIDDGTNTNSGNKELAVWDGSLNSGSGGWYTMGGDVI